MQGFSRALAPVDVTTFALTLCLKRHQIHCRFDSKSRSFIRFRDNGSANVQRIVGKKVEPDPQMVNLFAGLRDDPFIRLPREGRNIAAIVDRS